MSNGLKIFGFTILVAAFYSYVGQMVPQMETYPPEDTEIGADMTTEQLVDVGQQVFMGKGTCIACHTISGETGGRFPDLASIGAVAGQRRPDMTDVEYLAESIYEPDAYVVAGFLPGMPPAHLPPISLTDLEIIAVIAYLQSLGGAPTVTVDTEHRWLRDEDAQPAAAPAQPMTVVATTGEAIFQSFLCHTCHSTAEPTEMIGPSLYDVGSRLSRSEIYEAILDPDATLTEGYPAGVMSAQLNATGFYDRISSQQLRILVDYLASLTGN